MGVWGGKAGLVGWVVGNSLNLNKTTELSGLQNCQLLRRVWMGGVRQVGLDGAWVAGPH